MEKVAEVGGKQLWAAVCACGAAVAQWGAFHCSPFPSGGVLISYIYLLFINQIRVSAVIGLTLNSNFNECMDRMKVDTLKDR